MGESNRDHPWFYDRDQGDMSDPPGTPNGTTYVPILDGEYQTGAKITSCGAPGEGWMVRFTTTPPHLCRGCANRPSSPCLERVYGDVMMVVLRPTGIEVDGVFTPYGPIHPPPTEPANVLVLGGYIYLLQPGEVLPAFRGERQVFHLQLPNVDAREELLRAYDSAEPRHFRLATNLLEAEGWCRVVEISVVQSKMVLGLHFQRPFRLEYV